MSRNRCLYLHGRMTREQLAQFLSRENETGPISALDRLDERELEVFSILGQGYSTNQIHSEFGFAPEALRAIKQRIRAKLGIKDDAALLRVAARHRVSE